MISHLPALARRHASLLAVAVALPAVVTTSALAGSTPAIDPPAGDAASADARTAEGPAAGAAHGPPVLGLADRWAASAAAAAQRGPALIAAAAGETLPAPDPEPVRTVWDRLADCESGTWGADGAPVPGSATWDYGLVPGEDGLFQGGLQFHPATWDGFRDPGMPDHAGAATRAQQIAVAERVLAAQGWGAWPVCSVKMGIA